MDFKKSRVDETDQVGAKPTVQEKGNNNLNEIGDSKNRKETVHSQQVKSTKLSISLDMEE